jgi:hypothetical protein
MGRITLLSNTLNTTGLLIRDFNFMCSSQNKPAYFTRNGKLGFVNLIAFTLNLDFKYKTNVNILIGKLKDNLVIAILEPNPKKRDRTVQKVLAEIARNRTPIRPNRQFSHDKIPRKKRFYINKKSAL